MAKQKGRGKTPGWYGAGIDHLWLPYAQMKTAAPPLPVARTHGSRIVLADGRELIDGVASWWTACHGYNHPHIRQAVERQLAVMPHVMFGGLAHEQALTLARRLAALLPGDLTRVFFSDSGSVAVEVALKMAAQYWVNQGAGGRTKFIAFKGAYHGDTAGAMAVSDLDSGMHAAFAGLLPEHFVVDLPRDEAQTAALDKLLAERADDIAAIVVEPLVQGAGGMIFHDADRAPAPARACRQIRRAADLRRDFHRLWPHRHDVRMPGGGRDARHRHAVEGLDRRHAAARRHRRHAKRCSTPSGRTIRRRR